MKKIFSVIFAMLLSLPFSACQKKICLYEMMLDICSSEDFYSGSLICYGKMHKDSISEKSLESYLGLYGYPSFAGKIEELCVYSSSGEKYFELSVIRMYSYIDTTDAVLFLERRINAIKREKMFGYDTLAADSAYIKVYGNTAVLFMLENNSKVQKQIEKYL